MRALSLMCGEIKAAKVVDGDKMEIEPQASHSKVVLDDDLTCPLGLIRHDTCVLAVVFF